MIYIVSLTRDKFDELDFAQQLDDSPQWAREDPAKAVELAISRLSELDKDEYYRIYPLSTTPEEDEELHPMTAVVLPNPNGGVLSFGSFSDVISHSDRVQLHAMFNAAIVALPKPLVEWEFPPIVYHVEEFLL